jgi:nitroreductase
MTADADPDLAALVLALIGSRQSVAPKRLQAPGPSAAQLLQMVDAAASAPDHRALRPWRLIRIADHQRDALADLFEACARERQPAPGAAELAQSRAKAYRAPTLLLAVLKTTPSEPEVPLTERAVTLGAALMNLLLAAHGLGFAAMLTSGRGGRTARVAQALGLAGDELAVCFVSIGRAEVASHGPRGVAADFLGDWTTGPTALGKPP